MRNAILWVLTLVLVNLFWMEVKVYSVECFVITPSSVFNYSLARSILKFNGPHKNCLDKDFC